MTIKPTLCAVLSACILLSSAGCQSGADRAGLYRHLVEVGMSRDQVEKRLGEPDGWQENVGGYEVWAYSYKPNIGTFVAWRTVDLIGIAAAVVVMLGLIVITRGLLAPLFEDSEPSISRTVKGKDERFQRFVFRIGFDIETGKVAFVSSPLPE